MIFHQLGYKGKTFFATKIQFVKQYQKCKEISNTGKNGAARNGENRVEEIASAEKNNIVFDYPILIWNKKNYKTIDHITEYKNDYLEINIDKMK